MRLNYLNGARLRKLMNKDELIDKIVDKTKYPRNHVKEILETAIELIIENLKKRKKVKLVGFGSFFVKKRKGRRGVNPRTGKEIRIRDVKIARFKPGKRLREVVRK